MNFLAIFILLNSDKIDGEDNSIFKKMGPSAYDLIAYDLLDVIIVIIRQLLYNQIIIMEKGTFAPTKTFLNSTEK